MNDFLKSITNLGTGCLVGGAIGGVAGWASIIPGGAVGGAKAGCVLGTLITTGTACGVDSSLPPSPPPPPPSYDQYCRIETEHPMGYPQRVEEYDSLNRLLKVIVSPAALTKNPLVISPLGAPYYDHYKVSIFSPSPDQKRVLEQDNLCVSNWSWNIDVAQRYLLECRAEIATKGVFDLLNDNPPTSTIIRVKDNSLEKGNNGGNIGPDIHTYCGIIQR